MKKFKFILITVTVFLLFMTNISFSQVTDWRVANQVTIFWDASASLIDQDGNPVPIPVGDTIEYEVYSIPSGVDKSTVDLSSPYVVVSTTDATITLSISGEGRYIFGVRAVRIPQGETDRIPSNVVWSDEQTSVLTDTFGAKFYYLIGDPSNMR